MTFLFLLTLFLGVTEVYDESALMIFKPNYFSLKQAYKEHIREQGIEPAAENSID